MPEVVREKTNALLKPLALYAAQHFYRYPNVELIGKIQGQVLIIQAREDTLTTASHAERNLAALALSKLGPSPSPENMRVFRERYLLDAAGGHSSLAGGDKMYAWYRDAKTHAALSTFIKQL